MKVRAKYCTGRECCELGNTVPGGSMIFFAALPLFGRSHLDEFAVAAMPTQRCFA